MPIRPGPRGKFLVQVDGETIAEKVDDEFPAHASVIAKLKEMEVS